MTLSIIIASRFWDRKDGKIKKVSFPGKTVVPVGVSLGRQDITNLRVYVPGFPDRTENCSVKC